MGITLEAIEVYRKLIDAQEFPFRINAIPRVLNAASSWTAFWRKNLSAHTAITGSPCAA